MKKEMTEQEAYLQLATLCARAEHCQQEMRDKMKRWGLDEQVQERIVARLVKERFQVACAQCNELLTRPIRRVAICGGAGDFLLDDAVEQGADAFITGEMHYHVFFGREQQIQICVIGHYQSEQYTSEIFRDIIRRECPGVRTEIAETNTNPIVYL